MVDYTRTEKRGGLKDDTYVSGWMMEEPFTDVCDTGERAGCWGGVEMMSLAFDVLPRGAWVEHTEPELGREKQIAGLATERV